MSATINDFVKSCHNFQSRKWHKWRQKQILYLIRLPVTLLMYGKLISKDHCLCHTRATPTYLLQLAWLANFCFLCPSHQRMQLQCLLLYTICLLHYFGGCGTILSDQGTEFTAQVTSEVCRLMGISQQFTPSFVHNYLVAWENAPDKERLTPHVDKQRKHWDVKLPSIVFAINQNVNSTLGYSPFEIVFGYRPRFPLSPVSLTQFTKGLSGVHGQFSWETPYNQNWSAKQHRS